VTLPRRSIRRVATLLALIVVLSQRVLLAGTARYFVDANGTRLRHLNIEFGSFTTNLVDIVSTPLTLRLVDASPPGSVQQIQVMPGFCTIGGRRLDAKHVKVLLNNKASVTLAEAKAGVKLMMVVKNSEHREGVLNCEGFDILIQ
jgi:hypothetical protein